MRQTCTLDRAKNVNFRELECVDGLDEAGFG